MYCKHCGKYVDGPADVCPDCIANEMEAVKAEQASERQASEPTYNEQATSSIPTATELAKQNAYEKTSFSEESKPQPNKDGRLGFKVALTSTILGAVSAVLSFIGYILGVVGVAEYANADYYYQPSPAPFVFAFIFIAGATVLAIISILKGIKSIKTFIRAKKEGGKKPVATLILGISGISAAAYSALFIVISLFVVIIAYSNLMILY